jgi:hypothetical protein
LTVSGVRRIFDAMVEVQVGREAKFFLELLGDVSNSHIRVEDSNRQQRSLELISLWPVGLRNIRAWRYSIVHALQKADTI